MAEETKLKSQMSDGEAVKFSEEELHRSCIYVLYAVQKVLQKSVRGPHQQTAPFGNSSPPMSMLMSTRFRSR